MWFVSSLYIVFVLPISKVFGHFNVVIMEFDNVLTTHDIALSVYGSTTSLSKYDPVRHTSESFQAPSLDQLDVGAQTTEVGGALAHEEGSNRVSGGGDATAVDDETPNQGPESDEDSDSSDSDSDEDLGGCYVIHHNEREWDWEDVARTFSFREGISAILEFRDAYYEKVVEAKREEKALRRELVRLEGELNKAMTMIRGGNLVQEGLRDENERLKKEISDWRSLYAGDVDTEQATRGEL